MIEFYVETKYVPESNIFFKLVLKELSVTDIYCKTFDSLLPGNCMMNTLSYLVIDTLYCDNTEAKVEKDLSIQMVKVNLSSKEIFLKQDDSLKELYETE